jgi:hypothetical protein
MVQQQHVVLAVGQARHGLDGVAAVGLPAKRQAGLPERVAYARTVIDDQHRQIG